MKKILLFTATVVFGLSNVNAQTEKGKWMFGSDAGISFASSTAKVEFDGEELDGKSTVSTFTISPNAGYFIMDNLSIGLDLNFSSTKTKFEEEGFDEEFKTNSFAVFSGATYFFKTDKLAPYVGAGVGFLSVSEGDEDFDKYSGIGFNVRGGLAYFLSDSVSVNLGVDFISAKLSNKEESDFKIKSNTFGGAIGFAIYL
ncbi:MAG TPA: outer membrane beta-barrel protein [Flavobacteriaceae bacterium]